jgi:glutamine amidotransferase-like uncharacterized protein
MMSIDRRVALAGILSLAACRPGDGSVGEAGADILLFAGTGTSPNDVAAISAILRDANLPFAIVDTARVNAMDAADFRNHRLLIVPGGNFEMMGKALTAQAAANVRGAVMGGLNYLGICAGAFIAGNSPYNGFNLTEGTHFGFYAISAQGVRKSAASIATADGKTIEQYWEDGPQLSGWGKPIATYPDGTPAAVEGPAGEGWMVLVGTHPEAPESWRRDVGLTTPAKDSHAFARRLVEAALRRTRLSL